MMLLIKLFGLNVMKIKELFIQILQIYKKLLLVKVIYSKIRKVCVWLGINAQLDKRLNIEQKYLII